MIVVGDSDYTHALAVLMDRTKYNELDMLRAAWLIINRITYPKTGEAERSVLSATCKEDLTQVYDLLNRCFAWIRAGEDLAATKQLAGGGETVS